MKNMSNYSRKSKGLLKKNGCKNKLKFSTSCPNLLEFAI